MKRTLALTIVLTLAIAVGGCGAEQRPGSGASTTAPQGWGAQEAWTLASSSGFDPSMFVEGVDNPYWPLTPGTKWTYEAMTDESTETIDVEVLRETKEVAGVTCIVVHDVVKLEGELIEDTYDWYAQDKDGNVWYMGEDSREYENGEIVSTAGSWEAGVDGAQPGIKVWGVPHVDEPAYYQEFYKGEAEDLGKDIATDGVADTPAGSFRALLVVEEWTPLEPDVVERKYYKAGVGTVKEEMVRGGTEVVLLTRIEKP